MTKPRTITRAQVSRQIALVLLVLVAAGLLGACGYSTQSLYKPSIHTVAVPIWKNKTFRREWEFRLVEAIDKNIEARTPYKVATSDKADSELTGEIVNLDESVLTRRYGLSVPRETQITVVVNFTWKDLRTGKILLSRQQFNRSATEIPVIGERVDNAEQLAIERLAAAIVDQMQNDF